MIYRPRGTLMFKVLSAPVYGSDAKQPRSIRSECQRIGVTGHQFGRSRMTTVVDFVTGQNLRLQQLSTPTDFSQLNLKEVHEENRVEHLVPNQVRDSSLPHGVPKRGQISAQGRRLVRPVKKEFGPK